VDSRRKYGFGGIMPLPLYRLSIQSGYTSVCRRCLSSMPTPQLLDQVRIVARVKHFSLRPERGFAQEVVLSVRISGRLIVAQQFTAGIGQGGPKSVKRTAEDKS